MLRANSREFARYREISRKFARIRANSREFLYREISRNIGKYRDRHFARIRANFPDISRYGNFARIRANFLDFCAIFSINSQFCSSHREISRNIGKYRGNSHENSREFARSNRKCQKFSENRANSREFARIFDKISVRANSRKFCMNFIGKIRANSREFPHFARIRANFFASYPDLGTPCITPPLGGTDEANSWRPALSSNCTLQNPIL